MKSLSTTIFFIVVSLAACSNMTGLWQLDWQSMSMSYCIPDFLTISEDAQGNFTAVFNYTQATVTAHCAQNFTGNYSSNLTYNATTSAWMDSTNIQLSYNDSTDTLRYLYPSPTVQILYDRNGSYIPQNISMPYIGAVWTNITVTNSTGEGCSCTPSSILITQSPQATGLINIEPTFSSSDCYGLMNTTLGMIFIPDLQLLKWTGPATGSGTTNVYIFDPYTSVNQLTVQVWAWNASASASTNICQYSAQRFTDFTPLNGTWYLDWQSNSLALFVPGSIQATPEDNGAYISTYITYSLGNGTGYLIGGPNNQYFDSFKGLSFTYDEQTNTLLGFPNARFSYSVLFSPNGNLISNTFVDSNWTSPVLANGSSVPSTCCIPNTIRLTRDSNNQALEAEYDFDQDYESNPACQSLSQDITTNPYYVELDIGNPDISKLLWTDIYNSIISFANATTTSEITVQDFMDQPQCTFNMVINSSNPNPTPLSSNLMGSEIAYLVIGIFMILNWI